MLTKIHVVQRLQNIQARQEAGELPKWLAKTLRDGARVAYRVESKQRRASRRRVQSAREQGLIDRPGQCESCGAPGAVEGHHPDHSAALEIQWLCKQCHIEADRGVEMGQRYTKSIVRREAWPNRQRRLNQSYGDMRTGQLAPAELKAVWARLRGEMPREEKPALLWFAVAGLRIQPGPTLATEGVAA
jgi:hypothetical protein